MNTTRESNENRNSRVCRGSCRCCRGGWYPPAVLGVLMDRNKVLELAREAELARQFAMEVPFVVDRLERFAALIEREVRGDAEPVYPNAFLSDVMTAAGLVAHGKQSKALSERLLKDVIRLRARPAPAVVRQPLTEAQIAFLHDMSADGDYLDFARLIEAKHGIFEIAKVCPNCGSEDVTIMTQEENGEIVCAADVCQECGHQWNVG